MLLPYSPMLLEVRYLVEAFEYFRRLLFEHAPVPAASSDDTIRQNCCILVRSVICAIPKQSSLHACDRVEQAPNRGVQRAQSSLLSPWFVSQKDPGDGNTGRAPELLPKIEANSLEFKNQHTHTHMHTHTQRERHTHTHTLISSFVTHF